MRPFVPLFTSPHLQTIAGHYWPRDGAERRFPVESRLYGTEPDVQVLVGSQHPNGAARGHMVMVHGLEGSGEACYVRSLSAAALDSGFAAHRFNLRTCGGTEHLCRTLYHAGLTGDLLAVLREFEKAGQPPAVLVGFSLGGNVVLKLAGELGASARRWIRAVVSVSTPLDLAACAHRIGQPDNLLYHRRFVRRMKQRLADTRRYRPADYAKLRSVFEIDDRITAPSFGFGNAANYYATQSCLRFLPDIAVPGLLITAKDDTFVPYNIYGDPAIRRNDRLQLLATEHGGHLGFLSRHPPRFWLDGVIVEWAARLL
jgi:predicted alpha/beta-fold hydrolase